MALWLWIALVYGASLPVIVLLYIWCRGRRQK
jgi:hypothetical protein